MFAIKKILVRLIVSGIMSSVGMFLLGKSIVTACIPLFEVIIELAQSDFIPVLEVSGAGDSTQLRMSAIILHDIFLKNMQVIPTATHLTGKAQSLAHVLVPPTLLLCILAAWPVIGIKAILTRLAAGLVAMIAVMAFITPLTLVGLFQIGLLDATEGGPIALGANWFANWVLFTEGGGRWLIPIALGIACVAPHRFRIRNLQA